MSQVEHHPRPIVDADPATPERWEILISEEAFATREDWSLFHTALERSTASDVKVPALTEGPTDHWIAQWVTVARSELGTGEERLAFPVHQSAGTDRLQHSLSTGDAISCFTDARESFGRSTDPMARRHSTFWMLLSLIELGEDAAAHELAAHAIDCYPDDADIHYLAAVIAALSGNEAQCAEHRKKGLSLGPASHNDAFIFNVEELLQRLPQGEPPHTADEALLADAVDVRWREHSGLYGTYVGGNTMLVHTKWGGRIRIPSNDLSVGPILVTDGIYEPGLSRFIIGSLPQGGTFVDAGANLGVFSVLAGMVTGPAGRVIAIEAHPDLARIVDTNIAMNYLSDRASVRQVAISDRSGTALLNQAGDFLGDGWIDGDERAAGDDVIQFRVDTRPLDQILSDVGEIDILKIDIEGQEPEAFEGGAEVLGRTTWVVFEWNRTGLGSKTEAMIDHVRGLIEKGAQLGTLESDGSVRNCSEREAFAPPFRHGLVLKMR